MKKLIKKYKYIFLLGVVILVLSRCGSDSPTVSSEKNLLKDIKYSVENLKDTSFANVKRYDVSVVVSQKVTVEQLKEISKKIIEECKEKHKFNAITLEFYDYKEYIGTGYTLGKVTFAPKGDLSKATDVKTGDYSSMDYKFELRDKDWSKRLTQNEVSIWKQWHDEYMKQSKGLLDKNSLETPDEDKISEMIGKQNNISKEKVNEILIKQVAWAFEKK